MDIKEPFKIEGKRYYALIIIDDNSRYLLFCTLYEQITTEEVKQALKECTERILVDNDSRFKRKFERWCRSNGINVEHAPPYYLQAKGKVERCIRTFNEEFLRLKEVFENIDSFLNEFVDWFNNCRYHMGIDNYPANLYFSNNVTDVT